MPPTTKKLFSILKRSRDYLQYLIPVALVAAATLLKFYTFPNLGHKLPIVLYFLIIIICGIYGGLRPALAALIATIVFAYAIYKVPGIYDNSTNDSYSIIAAGTVACLLTLLIITSRTKITKVSRQKEEQFRFLVEAIPEKIWTADETGKASYYNQAWYEYTGINDFEDLHRQIWLLIHPDDLPAALKAYRDHIAEGSVYEVEVRLRRHDGVYRWHLNRTKPRIDSQGNITMWIGICTDIHDQKLAINLERISI